MTLRRYKRQPEGVPIHPGPDASPPETRSYVPAEPKALIHRAAGSTYLQGYWNKSRGDVLALDPKSGADA